MKLKISNYLAPGKTHADAVEEMFSIPESIDRYIIYDFEGKELEIDRPIYWPKEASRISYFRDGAFKFTFKDGRPGIAGGIPDGSLGDLGIGWGSENNVIRWMDSPRFQDMRFRGGDVQMDLVATTQATFDRCWFDKANVGVHSVFALQTNFNQCSFHAHDLTHVVLRSGVKDNYLHDYATEIEGDYPELAERLKDRAAAYFPGASATNSQSNHSVFRECRFWNNRVNGLNAVRILGTNGVVFENSVFEGLMPKEMIHFDYQGSTTVVAFTMTEPHIEYVDPLPSDTLFYIRGGLHIKLDGVYSQTGQARTLYADPSPNGYVLIENPHYIYVRNGKLEAADPVREPWIVKNPIVPNDWFESTSWVTAVPTNLFVHTHDKLKGYRRSPFLLNHATDSRIGVNMRRIYLGSETSNNEIVTSVDSWLDYRDNYKNHITVYRMKHPDASERVTKINYEK